MVHRVRLALELGVSPLVIGLSIVAVGTSLPELAASLASAMKGHAEIALGNVMGSNLFNLLGVMSLPGLFETLPLGEEVLHRDYASMLGITLLLQRASMPASCDGSKPAPCPTTTRSVASRAPWSCWSTPCIITGYSKPPVKAPCPNLKSPTTSVPYAVR